MATTCPASLDFARCTDHRTQWSRSRSPAGVPRSLMALFCLAALTVGSPTALSAQETEDPATAIRQVLDQVFSGMHEADSARVRAAHAEGARFALVGTENDPGALRYVPLDGWLSAIANSGGSWEERIYDVEIKIDDEIASAWVPYTFVLNGDVHHCGVNTSLLLRTGEGWKIVQTIFSSREEACPER